MSLTTSPPRQQIVDKINSYLQTNGSITAEEHKEIELLLVDAIYGAQIGDIKELAVAQSYITENFNMTGTNPGLGRLLKQDGITNSLPGERYGWAICNGLNGTVDKGGNVSVGYDPSDADFDNLTQPGTNLGTPGEKNITLNINQIPPHNHTIPANNGSGGSGGAQFPSGGGTTVATSIKGGLNGLTQAHNNMQPYIVTLFIQRIPV